MFHLLSLPDHWQTKTVVTVGTSSQQLISSLNWVFKYLRIYNLHTEQ